jgi:integrase
VRYWTVLDEDLVPVPEVDAFLRQVRLGRDGSESTTRAYAGGISLFLRWCRRTGRDCGPGWVNAVLTAVRGLVVHAVTAGQAPGGLVARLYEVADDRDLPELARGEDGRPAARLREPETVVDRASDEDVVALLGACRSARDRLVVLLMARAGLRRGELCGLRRSDVHLLPDSRLLGCPVARAHLHVVRRDNPNGAWAKSHRGRSVPLDFLVVQAFDAYELELAGVSGAGGGDFVFVNLFRGQIGAPMPPDAVNALIAAAGWRAGLDPLVRPHQLRHAFGSNLADAGAGLDEVAELLGHASMTSSQVYMHPDPGRLRAAVERVASPGRACRPPGERGFAGDGDRFVCVGGPGHCGGVRTGRRRRAGTGDSAAGCAAGPGIPGGGGLGPGQPGAVGAVGASAAGLDGLRHTGMLQPGLRTRAVVRCLPRRWPATGDRAGGGVGCAGAGSPGGVVRGRGV